MAGEGFKLVAWPPCQSTDIRFKPIRTCDDPYCCAVIWGGGPAGEKYTWPELVGKNGEEAKAVIEREYKIGTALVIPYGSIVTGDLCCNRIRVYVDKNNLVVKPPIVG